MDLNLITASSPPRFDILMSVIAWRAHPTTRLAVLSDMAQLKMRGILNIDDLVSVVSRAPLLVYCTRALEEY